MVARLIFAIVSTLVEETALVVIALWGLPRIGIRLPMSGLIALMVAWGVYSVISFQLVSRSLKRKELIGLPNMVGAEGEVVSTLAPEGLVRIKGELWVAKSSSGAINSGGKVIVVGQDGLKLVVREHRQSDDLLKLNS